MCETNFSLTQLNHKHKLFSILQQKRDLESLFLVLSAKSIKTFRLLELQ